jgi:hypothetical protein
MAYISRFLLIWNVSLDGNANIWYTPLYHAVSPHVIPHANARRTPQPEGDNDVKNTTPIRGPSNIATTLADSRRHILKRTTLATTILADNPTT